MMQEPIRMTIRHYPDGNGITVVQVIDHGHVVFAADRDPLLAELIAEARAHDLRLLAGEDVRELPMVDPDE